MGRRRTVTSLKRSKSAKLLITADQAPDAGLAQPLKRGAVESGAARGSARRSAARILILDHGIQQADQLRHDLESAGYEVDTVDRDAKAARHLRNAGPDLLVLDLTSRDVSGDLARLRFASRLRPIIALVDQESEGLRGLFAGADDFVIKPVSSIHLIARVQALLRRTKHGVLDPIIPPDVGPVLRVNDVELNLETRRVTRGGHDVPLGPTEYRLLTLFMGSPGRVFSRQHLLTGVFSDKPNTELRTVDVYVCRLRRELNRHASADALHVVRRVGYVMKPAPQVDNDMCGN